MFDQINQISIKGGYFETEEKFNFFDENLPVSVLYGRNGSGKTTIAKGIRDLAKTPEDRAEDEANGIEREYIATSTPAVPDEMKHSIFVFDEDFVGEYVKVTNEGVKAIVMLGEQVELNEQIKAKTEEQNKKKEEWNALDELRKKYEEGKEEWTPNYCFNRIRDALRKDGGWADRERDIKGNTLKSRITDDVIERLMKLEVTDEETANMLQEIKAGLVLYQNSKNQVYIEWTPPQLTLPENLLGLQKLLATQLESPELTPREERLMKMMDSIGHFQFSQEHTKELLEEGWEFCPTCLREIEDDDRHTIAETLKHILNEEAHTFENALNEVLESLAELETVLPVFPGELNTNEVNAANAAQAKLNTVIGKVKAKVAQRKRRIYEANPNAFTEEEFKEYETALDEYNKAIAKLGQCVETFNKAVKEHGDLGRRLFATNDRLAKKEYYPLFDAYKKALEEQVANGKAQKTKGDEIDALTVVIKGLKQKAEQTDTARTYINEQLQYVFYGDLKLKLEPGDGFYRIKINGKYVRPNKISVGERNVLGLCYFFANLFANKTEAAKYTTQYLIVIDDPVSSFDYGNRLGVMTLLRYQFNSIKKGNDKSRILVMSHDLYSVFNLVKIKKDVNGSGGEKYWELENKKINKTSVHNEYEALLNHVYDYAVSPLPDDPDMTSDMSIGDIMRRMLEAFSTFCYKSGFDEMFQKEGLLNSIPPTKQKYYSNFMCRLALNGESHAMAPTQALNTITPFFTRQEKVKTAKSLLLFLRYVNPEHLRAYLKEKVDEMDAWSVEEQEWVDAEEEKS